MMYVVLLAMISAVFAQPPACPPPILCPDIAPMYCPPPPFPEGMEPPLCPLPPFCAVAMADCPDFTSEAVRQECPPPILCPDEAPMYCPPPPFPEGMEPPPCPLPPFCAVAMADCPKF